MALITDFYDSNPVNECLYEIEAKNPVVSSTKQDNDSVLFKMEGVSGGSIFTVRITTAEAWSLAHEILEYLETYEELWRDIPGFDNYEISNLGRIGAKKSGRILTGGRRKDGRKTVCLYPGDGTSKTHLWGSLMASVWLPPKPTKYHYLHYIDGSKVNLRADNLEWRTNMKGSI